MEINKIRSYFGFAVKSGKVVWGSDQILKLKYRIPLVLSSESMPEKISIKIKAICPNTITVKAEELAFITGKDFVKACAVLNESLAKAILEEMKCQE